jgi:hypothetical protein
LLQSTDWARYGRHSGNPKCQHCMVHSGYEPTAVQETFGSLRGLWATAKAALFGVGASGPVADTAAAAPCEPRIDVPVEELVPAIQGARATPSLPIVQAR